MKAVKDKRYDIEWAEGVTNERPAGKVMAQVCRGGRAPKTAHNREGSLVAAE